GCPGAIAYRCLPPPRETVFRSPPRLPIRLAGFSLSQESVGGAREMTQTALFQAGGYRYVRGPFQYSGGVAAEPGYAIERVRFRKPLPLDDGFRAIELHLTTL